MKNIKACLTSNNQIWQTPKNIYDYYCKKDYFDPCPINPTFDGLKIEWYAKNFVNPPYKDIKKWIYKSLHEALKNKEIVLLIPARTDTQWFKTLIESKMAIIYFLEGRLKFSDKNSAPFPSMIVILNKMNILEINYMSKKRQKEIFGE